MKPYFIMFIYSDVSKSLSSNNVFANFDITSLFSVHLNSTLLFNAKSSDSLSKKIAVLKTCSLPESPKFQDLEESAWKPRAYHLALSLGV